jgi:hypothetical protein
METTIGIILGVAMTLSFVSLAYAWRVTAKGRAHALAKADLKSPPVPVVPEEVAPRPALAFDLNNPPKAMIYNPRSGVSTVRCQCHDRLLDIGEEILMWPNPAEEGAYFAICRPDEDQA